MKSPRIRRSQTITPFGVGSIFSHGGSSFVADDILNWRPGLGDELDLPRLALALRVGSIKQAPACSDDSETGPAIPFTRFPTWLFCQTCRLMARAKRSAGTPKCAKCGIELTPMRWVLVCENGHLDDVDWRFWAHSRGGGEQAMTCKSESGLRFLTVGRGGGLESLAVSCDFCKASRDLRDLMNLYPGRCRGKQPWFRGGEAVDCDASPRVLQRGAANVHFAVTSSAIDIPPHSDWRAIPREAQAVLQHSAAQTWRDVPVAAAKDECVKLIATALDLHPDVVKTILETEGAAAFEPGPVVAEDNLLDGEWRAFVTPRAHQDTRDRFVTRHATEELRRAVTPIAREASDLIDHLVLVSRLREVRALRGFSRITYSDKGKGFVPLGGGLHTEWLPGVELNGEGVFVALSEQKVQEWESLTEVLARCQPLVQRRENAGAEWLPEPSPRFVLLHTLAHVLIRQLAFDSGYSSSSVRERIFASPAPNPVAGILLYTAASDSEGTLGGLSRQGEPRRFTELLVRAIEETTWCSSDPICGESHGQGRHLLNHAACHSCALLSETSCVHSNSFLDRRLLVGPRTGFFNELQEMAMLRMEIPT